MAPQVPDINDITVVAGALNLSFRPKFSEIHHYKITLGLVDFVFTFLFIHSFT